MLTRTVFSDHHEQFRASVRRFIEAEIVPYHLEWERAGVVPRELWRKAGEAGMLCCDIDEQYGGPGGDFLTSLVVVEELARVVASGPGFTIHSDMMATYLDTFGTEQQKCRWLPAMAAGTAIGALAMTEPGAGSDLRGIRTRAVRAGNGFLISGQKVFISNGQLADLVLLACQTDTERGQALSMFIVETDRPGFARGRNLEKIGLKAQDTSELFFDNVSVPADNLIGELGAGLAMMKTKLARERVVQAASAATLVESLISQTVDYTAGRRAFGRAVSDFQNTRFKLAELRAKSVMLRTFVDRLIAEQEAGCLDAVEAAMGKLVATELASETADKCLQLHGGWGYMAEYPVSRAFVDTRVHTIAGGSAEIMRMIIGNEMFRGTGGASQRSR